MPPEKVALVTGANKGVGFAACELLAEAGCAVVLTARDARRGEAARARLGKKGLDVAFHPLDVADGASVARAAAFVEEAFGRLDILVNNAAILIDRHLGGLDLDLDTLRETMETNLYGPLRVSQALVPLMKRGGRIVNVSSWFGSMQEMHGGGYAAYRMSKACLNALTRILADELRGAGIAVNAACPGWVRTDMGGPGGAKSPREGADTPVWLALLPDGGPTGGFFRDRGPTPW